MRVIRKEDGSWKKVIFYNTTVTALLQHNGQYLEKMRDVFRVFYENRDEVALLLHPDAYSLGIWEMKQGDVAEVDSLDQLIAFDCSYQKFKGGGIHE